MADDGKKQVQHSVLCHLFLYVFSVRAALELSADPSTEHGNIHF